MIRATVMHKLQRKHKNRHKHTALIILLGVLGFVTFSVLVVTGIFFFVLRPAYRALREFVNALSESDYALTFDTDEFE